MAILNYDPDQPVSTGPQNPNLLQDIESVQPTETPSVQMPDTPIQEKTVSTPGQPTDYVPEQATVAGQLPGILESGSPVMRSARADAMQQAQQRGLLNTTMAGTMGQKAVIDRALQIATPDAQAHKEAAARKQTTDYQGALNTQQAQYRAEDVRQQGAVTGAINEQQAQIQSIRQTQEAQVAALIDQEKISSGLRQTLMQDISDSGATLQTNFEYVLRDPDLSADAKTNAINILVNQYQANAETAASLAGIELTWSE